MGCWNGLRTAMALRLCLLASVLAGMSGCARLNSIYRSENLDKDSAHIVSMDAKQRVVLANPASRGTADTKTSVDSGAKGGERKAVAGTVQSQADTTALRFCAEPPPDVFTALASSLGAEVSLNRPAAPDAALVARLATTLSENAATIERTQTVNILREVMYRNCERYLSGAISADELIVQAARDQQLIVQVLAVEQITGVARAQSAALTTVARAAANGVTDTGLEILASAKKDHDAKRAVRDKAIKDAVDLPPSGSCETGPIDRGNLPAGVTAGQADAKNAQCDAARAAVSAAREAENYLRVVQEAVAKQGGVSSETRGHLASAAQTASRASAAIADRVVEIVKQYQAFDEIGMTCVVQARLQGSLPEYCVNLIDQMADTLAAQLRLEEARLDAVRVKAYGGGMADDSRRHAEAVWSFLGGVPTADKLKEVADKAGTSIAEAHVTRLVNVGGDFGRFLKAFARLAPDVQAALAKAATAR